VDSDPRAVKMREWLRGCGANLMLSDGLRGLERLEMREGVELPLAMITSNEVVVPFGFDQAEPNYLATRFGPMLESSEKQGQLSKTIWLLQPGFDSRLNTRQDSFCFKTRNGTVGILQILNPEDNPPGVRIRYKLVQNTPTDRAVSHRQYLFLLPQTSGLGKMSPIVFEGWQVGYITDIQQGYGSPSKVEVAGLITDSQMLLFAGDVVRTIKTGMLSGVKLEIVRNSAAPRTELPGGSTILSAVYATSAPAFSNPAEVKVQPVATATPQNLSYGPVVERVIDTGNPSRRALNLAFGNFVEPGPGRPLDFSPAGTNTLRAAGADLYAQDGAPAGVLTTLDMRLCVGLYPQRENETELTFDSITDDQVRMLLADAEKWRTTMETSKLSNFDLRLATGRISGTNVFLFITRNDVQGVLQITGFSENPRGVKIRFNLVQNEKNKTFASPNSVSEPADLRLARARLTELRVDYSENHPEVLKALARIKELERLTKEEPNDSEELREAKARLAELRVDYSENNPAVLRGVARVNELERLSKEEPNASAELREAKANLAELRVDYSDQHPEVQKALARIKALEQK
jgi:hypothetical protein